MAIFAGLRSIHTEPIQVGIDCNDGALNSEMSATAERPSYAKQREEAASTRSPFQAPRTLNIECDGCTIADKMQRRLLGLA